MRGDYGRDPGLSAEVFTLLDRVFPGIAASARRIRDLGGVWERCSVPFVLREGNQVLCHVGLIPLTLWIQGRETPAATLHAVATRAECRGRGLYRAVMQELLAWAEERFPTLVLTTEHPEYFTDFGFSHRPESAFLLDLDHPGGAGDLRPLDLGQPGDLAVLHRLLDGRAPLSRVLGVGPQREIFLFNESRGPLWYSEALDVLLVLEIVDGRLRLLDVVAQHLPAWEDLLACLPWPVTQVVFEFCPEGLVAGALPHARLFEHDGPSWLMVRGSWLPEGIPFTLPRSCRT